MFSFNITRPSRALVVSYHVESDRVTNKEQVEVKEMQRRRTKKERSDEEGKLFKNFSTKLYREKFAIRLLLFLLLLLPGYIWATSPLSTSCLPLHLPSPRDVSRNRCNSRNYEAWEPILAPLNIHFVYICINFFIFIFFPHLLQRQHGVRRPGCEVVWCDVAASAPNVSCSARLCYNLPIVAEQKLLK